MTTTTTLLNPFRVAARTRDLRLLISGLAASQVGDWLYNLALLALVYDRTGSTTWVGVATAARVLPLVVLAPLGGIVADRVDRRRLLIGSDLVRAGCMAALVAVAATGAPIVLAPLVAALGTAAGAAYPSAVVAIVPRLVADEDLPAANAARVSITHICVVAGPVIGAVLLLLGSAALAFAVNGVTFLIGAAVVAALPREALHRPAEAAPAGVGGGLAALRSQKAVLPAVGADVLASALYGALTVLFVLLGASLGLGPGGYGYLLSASALGGILGAGAADRAAASGQPRLVLAAAVVALGAPLPFLGLAGWVPGVLALAAFFGTGQIVTEVVADTTLQRSLDPAVFGRAYGIVLSASIGGIAAGALLAPLAVSLLGLEGTLIALGALSVGYGAALTPRLRARAFLSFAAVRRARAGRTRKARPA
jgi:predicted MFS family arabinose efflux permease